MARWALLSLSLLIGYSTSYSQIIITDSQTTTTQLGIDRLVDQPENESYQHLFVPDLCTNINNTLESIVVDININSITHPNNPDCAGIDIQALYYLPNNCNFNQTCDIQGQILSERCAMLEPAATAPGSFSLEITDCSGGLAAYRANPVVPIDIVPVTPNSNTGSANNCDLSSSAITDGWVNIDYTITVTWTFSSSDCDDGDPCTSDSVMGTGNNCSCVNTFADDDGDGICDALDSCPGFDDNLDSDSDGVPDGCDNCPSMDNASQSDFDSDGVGNTCDDDDDNDGVPDNMDCAPLDPTVTTAVGDSCDDGDATTINDVLDVSCICVGEPDQDGDGIADASDNCPTMPNPDQDDFDSDGMGDACDDDDDDDGLSDGLDCEPLDATIAFSIFDPCDDGDPLTVGDIVNASCICEGESDQDSDGIADAMDNCPAIANADQADFDSDGMGDACDDDDDDDGVLDDVDCDPLDPANSFVPGDNCDDGEATTINDIIDASCACVGEPDQDGDGIADAIDNCPTMPNPDQDDFDSDGMGDACDDDDDDDGVLDDVDCDPLDDSINFAIGDTCDDGDATTMDDTIDVNCMCIGSTAGDQDGDGIPDATDNCPMVANPDQDDFDNDGMGDACDDDDDNDGVLDNVDCGPLDDTITFAQGDTCDDGDATTMDDTIDANCMCIGSTAGDQDGDGIPDATDNCPMVTNPDQDDFDNDGIGDTCDDDDDDDGILDDVDCNPQDATINFAIGDTCDDGDPCTVSDAYDMDCNCLGTFSDTDGDGVCDADDQCAGSDDNVDEDNNGIPDGCESCTVGGPCDDGDDCTTDDTFDMDCNCIGTAIDCSNGVIIQMPCDDGNPNTDNDTEFFLECTGEVCLPCIGIPQTIEEDLFYVPSAFSPNGDGVNDTYTLGFREQVLSIELFSIYDRYGGLIFSLNNVAPNQTGLGWDGTFDRQEAPTGVYVYVLRVIAIDGSTVTDQGTLTLTR